MKMTITRIGNNRVDTHGKVSGASLLRKQRDPYIKAIRWFSDRIKDEGIVCLVTNSSFVHDHSLDGVRACLETEFDSIYLLDLGGNVRKNPKLSGTTHNVFGIQPGVSINIFVRHAERKRKSAVIRYAATDEWWRKEQKYEFLEQAQRAGAIEWRAIKPDVKHGWVSGGVVGFEALLPLAPTRRDRGSKSPCQYSRPTALGSPRTGTRPFTTSHGVLSPTRYTHSCGLTALRCFGTLRQEGPRMLTSS